MSLVLKVEILAGTDESTAAVELAMLATDMDVIVEATHNGVVMRAHPGEGPEKTLDAFKLEQELERYPKN